MGCEVQHALHFHVIEGRVSGYHLVEALEIHAMTPRRGGLDDHLTFVGADAHLTFAEGVADGFVFLAHNHLRRLQQVVHTLQSLKGTDLLAQYKAQLSQEERVHQKLLQAIDKAETEEQEMEKEEKESSNSISEIATHSLDYYL